MNLFHKEEPGKELFPIEESFRRRLFLSVLGLLLLSSLAFFSYIFSCCFIVNPSESDILVIPMWFFCLWLTRWAYRFAFGKNKKRKE